ncbi:hypothetical protein IQ231_08530 [Cuspidothrix issatschenkoi LEGE 03284]|uniref:cysteine-rich KTR domain-containing protein n=1 Tax=Cuspidothrix issatschenkoi TaxID=230752 RepID=UPI0018812E39|nr:hypothetical protein [Cuspidothrix issatschenkoi LEGE 03284]
MLGRYCGNSNRSDHPNLTSIYYCPLFCPKCRQKSAPLKLSPIHSRKLSSLSLNKTRGER